MQALASLNKKSHKVVDGAGDGAVGKVSAAPGAVQQQQQQDDLTEWKALLCTLIADRELKPLRHDGKRLLRRLCVSQVTASFVQCRCFFVFLSFFLFLVENKLFFLRFIFFVRHLLLSQWKEERDCFLCVRICAFREQLLVLRFGMFSRHCRGGRA